MTEFETWTLILTFIIALGGWVFAAWQHRSNQQERRKDQLLTVRQQKANRVLEQLDSYAELEDLYRFLANQRKWIVTDEDGQFVENPDGTFKTETRTFEMDPALEQALASLEDVEDIRGALALLTVRIHNKQSQSTDILHDLEPSGQVAKALDVLYVHTIPAFESALKSEDLFRLIDILNESANERRIIRAYVNYLAENTTIEGAKLPPLPTLRSIAQT